MLLTNSISSAVNGVLNQVCTGEENATLMATKLDGSFPRSRTTRLPEPIISLYRLSWNSRAFRHDLTSCAYYQDPFNLIGLQPDLIVLSDHSPVEATYLAIVRQSRWVVVVGNGNRVFLASIVCCPHKKSLTGRFMFGTIWSYRINYGG